MRIFFRVLIIFSFFCGSPVWAFLKISVGGGFGSFSGEYEGLSKSEGPLSFQASIDYDINSRWSLGAEHVRSLSMSPLGTSVAMTGFTGRWYYLGPVPNPLSFDTPFLRARILQKGFFPYLGWSFGFAQASILGKNAGENIVALNIAAALKGGFDYPILQSLAVRSELNLGFPLMGTGKINYAVLLFSGVLFW